MRIPFTQFPGVAGLCIIVYALIALPISAGAPYFFAGTFLMTCTAVLERHAFFITLQMVVLTGTILGMLSDVESWVLTILLMETIGALWWSLRNDYLKNKRDILGFISLCVLAFAYGFGSEVGFLLGGLLIVGYSYLDARAGNSMAVLWMVLNFCFAVAAAVAVFGSMF